MRFTRSGPCVIGCLALLACGDDGVASGGSGGQGGSPSSGGDGQGATPATGGAGAEAPTTSSGGGGGEGGTLVDPWTPLVSLKELDLGELDVGQDSTWTMPDRVLGFTTLSETAESGLFGIGLLRAPLSNGVIVNFEIPGTDLPYFIDEFALNGANPLSERPDAWPIKTGTWRIRLASDETPVSARSRLFVRRTVDGNYHGGVVDVHVRIAPGVADEGYMSAVLSTMFNDYYGPLLGLSQGTITYGSISSSFTVVDSNEEFKQLLSSSSASDPAPAVNLFVVGDFSGDLSNALGIAGGIPGSPMVHATRRSGVAYTPTGNAGYDATVLAHEIGHLAGLFHTTELQDDIFDPYSDTAACPNIEGNPDSCPDVPNIMFPIAYGGYELSTNQRRAIHGSAIYRGIIESGGAPSPSLLPPDGGQGGPSRAITSAIESAPFVLPRVHAPEADDLSGLTRLVHGHWCARSGDVETYLAERMVDADGTLLAILDDDGAFDLARGRALRLLARSARSDQERELVIDRARAALASAQSGRRLRIAAITTLDTLSPAALQEEIVTTPALEDPVIVRHLELRGL